MSACSGWTKGNTLPAKQLLNFQAKNTGQNGQI